MVYVDLKNAYFTKYNKMVREKSASGWKRIGFFCCMFLGCDESKDNDAIHSDVTTFIDSIEEDDSLVEEDKLFLLTEKLTHILVHHCDIEQPWILQRGHFIGNILLKFFEIKSDTVSSFRANFEHPAIDYVLVLQVLKRKLLQLKERVSQAVDQRLKQPDTNDESILLIKRIEINANDRIHIPSFLVCPLSKTMMTNPVLCTLDGNTYERKWIEDYLFYHPEQIVVVHECSMHRSVSLLVENKNIKDAISAFCRNFKEENPELIEGILGNGLRCNA